MRNPLGIPHSVAGGKMRKYTPLLVLIMALPLHGEVMDQAPRFSAENLDGQTVSLDSLLAEGPVFVSFWALWCKPCIRELDELKPIWEKHHENGFEIVAVSQDGPRSVSRVKPMVRSKGWDFTVVLDPDKELSRAFQVIALPTSFLIDAEGSIVRAQQGYKPGMEEAIEEEIEKLLSIPEQDDEPGEPEENAKGESSEGSQEEEETEQPVEERDEEPPSAEGESGCGETTTQEVENKTQ
jgi:peroxiredoxin